MMSPDKKTVISADFKNAPLRDALEKFLAESGLMYVVDPGVNNSQTITFSLKNVPI
jgi:type II secretory pathway component GspD/PulD (secretin)